MLKKKSAKSSANDFVVQIEKKERFERLFGFIGNYIYMYNWRISYEIVDKHYKKENSTVVNLNSLSINNKNVPIHVFQLVLIRLN